jgi:hypothetical protein
LYNVAWDGKESEAFRKYFKNGPRYTKFTKNNKEHCIESLLLTEFSKNTRNKVLRNIQPVKICKIRFPIPTTIKASKHGKLEYSFLGGHVDILARTGSGGKATHLCIMELKDENNKSEPPKAALEQAVAYATFIRELLRSDAGAAWWKLFGFQRAIPKRLELFAACVMPSNDNNDYSFRNRECNVEEDTIKLHYLYFNEEQESIKIQPENATIGIVT